MALPPGLVHPHAALLQQQLARPAVGGNPAAAAAAAAAQQQHLRAAEAKKQQAQQAQQLAGRKRKQQDKAVGEKVRKACTCSSGSSSSPCDRATPLERQHPSCVHDARWRALPMRP